MVPTIQVEREGKRTTTLPVQWVYVYVRAVDVWEGLMHVMAAAVCEGMQGLLEI